MGFCVYHFEKGKSQASAIGNHIDRTPGQEHSYTNANPSLKHLNRNYTAINKYCGKPLQEAIVERIKDGYQGKKAIRRDAVKHIRHVLTGSHEDMHRIAKNKDTFEKWINANYNFMIKEFGKDNIVRFVLHMDERTPHIHCVTVPLLEDGRLSAKLVTGNRLAMQERQTRYGQKMAQFGLERGVKESKAKHTKVKEFYKVINEEDKTQFTALTPNVSDFPNIQPPTKMEVLRGKTEKWNTNVNLQLEQWVNSIRYSLENKTEEISKEYQNEIKKKRFKDISLTFAMKRKGELDKTIKRAKNNENRAISELDCINKERELERSEYLEVVKNLKKSEKAKFSQGANRVINEANEILKEKNIKIQVKENKIEITETLKAKIIKDKPKGRGL